MKLFAIVTAGLMAAGGGSYYLFGTSTCSGNKCGMRAPVATSGGCCSTAADVPSCCAAKEECCELQQACCAVATGASAKKADCCYPEAPCCVAQAECCLAGVCCATASAKAVKKPIEIESCCEAPAPTAARVVSGAAKSIAGAK